MLIYEIEAQVEGSLLESFEEFMSGKHIPDLLKTGFFESADMSEPVGGRVVIRYEVKDRETLDRYLETKAVELRDDFLKHFPKGVTLSRNIYEAK